MSITNQSLGGRAYLVKKLMSGSFSRLKSVAVVSVILERMIDGLRRGEEVEFVYGTLVRVRNSFGQWWDVVDDWPANRQPYTVEWELSPEGRELLFGPLEKAEQAYMRRPGRRPRRRSGAAGAGRSEWCPVVNK